MTKRWYRALEKVFAREIEGALRGWGRVYQSKSKVYEELEAAGLVKRDSETLRFKDGLPPMTVGGWSLTIHGNLQYCTECDNPKYA